MCLDHNYFQRNIRSRKKMGRIEQVLLMVDQILHFLIQSLQNEIHPLVGRKRGKKMGLSD